MIEVRLGAGLDSPAEPKEWIRVKRVTCRELACRDHRGGDVLEQSARHLVELARRRIAEVEQVEHRGQPALFARPAGGFAVADGLAGRPVSLTLDEHDKEFGPLVDFSRGEHHESRRSEGDRRRAA